MIIFKLKNTKSKYLSILFLNIFTSEIKFVNNINVNSSLLKIISLGGYLSLRFILSDSF